MSTFRSIISETSPAAPATTASTIIIYGMDKCDDVTVVAELVGATGGTLDVYLQTSWDGGTTWYDWIHFPQLAAAAAAVKYMSATPAPAVAPIVIGKGTTPALAANTRVGGQSWGPAIRALYVAGAATSAGAAVSIQFFGFQRKL